MYELTIRKSCKAEKALHGFQKAYGLVINWSYKSIWKVYGFDQTEVAVFMEEQDFRIKKVVFINE